MSKRTVKYLNPHLIQNITLHQQQITLHHSTEKSIKDIINQFFYLNTLVNFKSYIVYGLHVIHNK